MRWKQKVTGALLAGLLTFTGQFIVDFFFWHPDPNETEFENFLCLYSPEETMFDYTDFIRTHLDWADNDVREVVLMLEGALLFWLTNRGSSASQASLIFAFFSLLTIHAWERIQVAKNKRLRGTHGHNVPT